eukprot:37753-Hanusia_phi.AAC.2
MDTDSHSMILVQVIQKTKADKMMKIGQKDDSAAAAWHWYHASEVRTWQISHSTEFREPVFNPTPTVQICTVASPSDPVRPWWEPEAPGSPGGPCQAVGVRSGPVSPIMSPIRRRRGSLERLSRLATVCAAARSDRSPRESPDSVEYCQLLPRDSATLLPPHI